MATATGAVLSLLALQACGPTQQPSASARLAEETSRLPAKGSTTSKPGDKCGASAIGGFIHQPDSGPTRARLAAVVGHDQIRWIHPGDVVTQDYRPDRLNVMFDDERRIVSARCG